MKLFVSPTAPLVIDLARGRIGTFLGKTPSGREGRVNIVIRPLNSLSGEETIRDVSLRGGIVDVPNTYVTTDYDWKIIVDDGIRDPPPIIESFLKMNFTEVLNKIHEVNERFELKNMALSTERSELEKERMENKIDKILKDKKEDRPKRGNVFSNLGE